MFLDLLLNSDQHGSFSISRKATSVKSYFQRSWNDMSFSLHFPFVHFLSAAHIISYFVRTVAACLSNLVAHSNFSVFYLPLPFVMLFPFLNCF